MNDKVRGLVEKWRGSANGAKRYSTTEYEDGHAAAELRCANELEQALAAPAEGAEVVWQTRFMLKDTGYWSGWAQCESEDSADCLLMRWATHGFTAQKRRLIVHPEDRQSEKV